MATGSYDPQTGVWINGEDDSYPTFSARLNKSVVSIRDAIKSLMDNAIGPWTAYTPTFTNLTPGTGGAVSAVWRRERDLIRVHVRVTLGSSGFTVGSIPTMTIPVEMFTPASPNARLINATTYYDVSANQTYAGDVSCVTGSTTSVRLLGWPAGASGLALALNGTSPFTFAAGDVLSFEFVYRAKP